MADVQPLRGLRYSREYVQDLSQVITPPFDIISPEAQQRYYDRHPYNIIRLELGKTQPDDDKLDNVYTRAAATLSEWRLQDILQQEKEPGYYLYQQRFTHRGQIYIRTSLLARVRLEPWEARVILPHEHIRTKDKEDRLNLLRACSTNFSPIMSMYEDPQGRIRRLLTPYAEKPEVHIVDELGEEHLLHPITDPDHVALIRDFFAPRQLYIADGHHRYTTALQYRDEVREQRKELAYNDSLNYVMMALIDVDDPGWLVYPTHRLLFDLQPEQLAQLTPERLSTHFSVEEITGDQSEDALRTRLATVGERSPSFIVKTHQRTLLLTLNEQGRVRMTSSTHSSAWNELDVSVLQLLLLEDVLGLTSDDIAAGRHIRYSHDFNEALAALDHEQVQVVALLNSIPLRQVCAVAQADDRMPQKSTYIYPKLITGLLLNPLW